MRGEVEVFSLLVRMARLLRGDKGCPWDRAQDEASLARCVLAEAQELDAAVASGDSEHIREEVGDILFALISMTVLAEEKGDFSLTDLLTKLEAKMIRRHPHVFGDASASTVEDVLRHWNEVKESERTGES